MGDSEALRVEIAAVEDRPGQLEKLERAMTQLGYKLVCYRSFDEGYQRIIEDFHELAFIDVGLEGPQSGADLAKRILKVRPYFFSVFYTGQPLGTVKEEIEALGVTQYVIILKEQVPTVDELVLHVDPILRWRHTLHAVADQFKRYWGPLKELLADADTERVYRAKTAVWEEVKQREHVVFPSGEQGPVPIPGDLIDEVEEKIHRLAEAANVAQIGLLDRVKDSFLQPLLQAFTPESPHARLVVATGLSLAQISRLDYKGENGRKRFESLVDVLRDVANALREASLSKTKVRSLEYGLQAAGAELSLGYDAKRLEELKSESDNYGIE